MIILDHSIKVNSGAREDILVKVNDPVQLGTWGMHRIITMEAPVWLGRCQIDTEFIGAFTLINIREVRDVTNNCVIECQRIGRFGTIGHSVCIGLATHSADFLSPHTLFKFHNNAEFFARYMKNRDYAWEEKIRQKNFVDRNKPLPIIGNDVWIGYGATVMNGVMIGDGAVIAAKSVVTKDVQPYTIVGGNPATVIRQRFSDKCIEKLLKIKWWDYGPDILKGLDIDKPEECIDQLEERAGAMDGQFVSSRVCCDIETGTVKVSE